MRHVLTIGAALLAVSGGPALATYEGGMAALDRHDVVEAVREFTPPAQAGDAESQYRLGLLYYVGWGAERNYAIAADWLSRASRQSHYRAQYILANLYANGLGVELDYDMARRLYRSSAEGVRDATQLDALATANGVDRLLEAQARQQASPNAQAPQNAAPRQGNRRSGS